MGAVLKKWIPLLVGIGLSSLLLGGCLDMEKVGRKATRGAVMGVTDPVSQDSLEALLDRLGEALNRQAVALRDSLLGDVTEDALQTLADSVARNLVRGAVSEGTAPASQDSLEALVNRLGEALNRQAVALRASLLGASSQASAGALGDRLGTALREQMVALRDSLVGTTTQKALAEMVDRLVVSLGKSYQRELEPILLADVDSIRARGREDVGFIKKNVTGLLITAGVVVAILMGVGGLLLLRFLRQRKMLQLLTYQIHKIPDEQAYDELTHRIQDKAQETGLEPHLRQILEKQGLPEAAPVP